MASVGRQEIRTISWMTIVSSVAYTYNLNRTVEGWIPGIDRQQQHHSHSSHWYILLQTFHSHTPTLYQSVSTVSCQFHWKTMDCKRFHLPAWFRHHSKKDWLLELQEMRINSFRSYVKHIHTQLNHMQRWSPCWQVTAATELYWHPGSGVSSNGQLARPYSVPLHITSSA
jgi:hypothetical protein